MRPCGRILIVDDDPAVRALLTANLERAGHTTSAAGSGHEALILAAESLPDLVLLDVNMPDLGGYAVCRELRERYGERLPILFISGERIDSGDRTAGLLIGGDDYVLKPFDPGELLARVRRYFVRAGPDSDRSEVPPPALGSLTPRESEVLALLAEGLSQREIAERLVIGLTTVGTHIQRVLTKLHVHNRTQAVALALRARNRRTQVEDAESHV
jgi:DNA-binding NarL/FixJ family response regulator